MRKTVFDASALITLLIKEKGHETIRPYLPDAIISTVNLAEVYKCLLHVKNLPEDVYNDLVDGSGIQIIDFNQKQAYKSAQLYKETKGFGLSLADRSCLALAKAESCPSVTCDRVWASLNLDIECIIAR